MNGSEGWCADRKAEAALEVASKAQDLVLALDRLLAADERYYSAVERARIKQQKQWRALAGAVAS